MTNDDRDVLQLLKDELAFIEKGGYGRSVRTPWLPKSIFQDSLSCRNYGYPYRAHPCHDCCLFDFVSEEHRGAEVPCHQIALNSSGETIEDLESQDNQPKLEAQVKQWLQLKIAQLELQSLLESWGLSSDGKASILRADGSDNADQRGSEAAQTKVEAN